MKSGLIVFILILCIATAVMVPAAAEEPATAQSQIERAVVSYAATGTRDDQALLALASLDPALGDKWARIMKLWETPVAVNEALPDDLPEDDSLCLVGLGFQLNPDGTMREELIERLKVMLVASEKYPNAVIVCTGGGTAADDPKATEAGRMGDYHIATGVLLFGAEAILRDSDIAVVSNAAWHAPTGTLSPMFQAGALIELSGDVETAFDIYYETYDIHELPPLREDP